jgi:hypothetical protein
MLLLTVFDQISGSIRAMLLFLITEKVSWRAAWDLPAALWPCVEYILFKTYYTAEKLKMSVMYSEIAKTLRFPLKLFTDLPVDIR